MPLLRDWISRKSVNHTNWHNKTLYNNANFLSLGKIFDKEDIVQKPIVQNIQEIPITQTVQSVL